MRVNFYNKDRFRFIYKREPKTWSIQEVHDLWVKAKQRNNNLRKRFNDFIDSIPNQVEQNSDGNYILYYNINNSVQCIILNFKGRFGGWSYHTRSIDEKDRDLTLRYWISDDKITELGNEFIRLERNRGFRLEAIVNNILSEMIDQHFRKYFENLKKYPPETFIVNISDKSYIVYVDDRLNFPRYKLSSELTEPINLN
jgi:hypothetical protein